MLMVTETKQNLQESARFVCEAIPGCRLVIVEGHAHSAMIETRIYSLPTCWKSPAAGPAVRTVRPHGSNRD
jgi:hypothetical protein